MTLGFGNQYSIQLSYGRMKGNLRRAFYPRTFRVRFDEILSKPYARDAYHDGLTAIYIAVCDSFASLPAIQQLFHSHFRDFRS